jgi:hypothetical protein
MEVSQKYQNPAAALTQGISMIFIDQLPIFHVFGKVLTVFI